ncbi:hypothetical protein MTR67_050843 [Solanum verrucosum]|uniref:Reverse transcriptase Ty1/copia-type domain-containing protein n=1 Tax=Solanum verrucosum TaxID=315347 RepID=A0AAF0V274_SOLVR|nr:hypothetical protein MTR67_050843 [Solanum verrucosum]
MSMNQTETTYHCFVPFRKRKWDSHVPAACCTIFWAAGSILVIFCVKKKGEMYRGVIVVRVSGLKVGNVRPKMGLTKSEDKRLVDDFIESMKAEFAMKDLGSLHYFLGVEIVHNTAGALLLQRKYISNLLHRFDLAEVKPVQTPLYSKLDWHSVDTQLLDNPFMYRKMVGSLQYLSFTRPDIQYAVNMASQFLHQPRLIHFQAIKRIFRYLKGTPAHGLQLNKNTFHSLTPFLDSDWAGCTTTRRSTSRFCIFLGSNLISWSTKKQPIVVRLSTEAKYRALAVATTDVIWIQFLLRELGIYLPTPILAKCDNIGAIHLAHNPVFHSRSKHVALDYHFIREKIAQGDLTVSHVPTSQQLADVFTKDVSITKFKAFWVNLHVRSSSSDCGRVIRILL